MISYDWKIINDRFYYFEKETGRIVGFAHKYALQDVWNSVVYIGKNSYTRNDEVILGQYIDVDHARAAVASYWEIESRTLLE